MLMITIRFQVRPEWCDRWLDLVDEFTQATRSEPGTLWFRWSRSVDDPCEFVLVEAHRDEDVEEHLSSPLIPKIQREWPQALVATPKIVVAQAPGDDWSPMAQLPVPAPV